MSDDDSTQSSSENLSDVIVPDKSKAIIEPEKTKGTSARDTSREFQAVVMEMFQSGGRSQNPLLSKFNDAHIDKYLDYIQRDDDHAYELNKTNRWFYLAYFVISLVVLGAAVVYLLPNNKDFLDSIVKILIAMAGGIGAGYGLSKRKEK
jgi:hypothetical protein